MNSSGGQFLHIRPLRHCHVVHTPFGDTRAVFCILWSLFKKIYVEDVGCPSGASMHCSPSLDQSANSCQKYPLFSISFRPPPSLPFFSRRGAERWDRKSPQRLGPPSVSLMDVRCVWEEAVAWVCFMLVLSVMSREAAGDEQKPPRPPLQYLHFLFCPLPSNALCRFSQCNILVLIKANKGKHSVMGQEDILVSWRTRQQPLYSFSL